MATNISNLKFPGSAEIYSLTTPYGTCTTAASTAAKVVTSPSFLKLETGSRVTVKFTNASAVSSTLNVNSTGAIAIRNSANSATSSSSWSAGSVVSFVYDGTYWYIDEANPISHASSGTGYGAGTTSNYGHVKLNNGDQNGLSGASGIAAGQGHTHSQYLTSYVDTNTYHVPDYTTGIKIASADGTGDVGDLYVPTGTTANTVAVGNHTHSQYAPIESPTFTGTPKAPTPDNSDNSTRLATTAYVKSLLDDIFVNGDAMIFKGTIGTNGTITSLPAAHTAGWTYKVITAGTYAGQKCEIGDLIICITDGSSANNAHWTVVQSNTDGHVTGPASSVTNRIATFDGTSGKLIKDSGYTTDSFSEDGHNHTISGDTGASSGTTTVYSITGVGSAATRESVTIPTSGHTHTISGTASATATTGTTTVYSITDVGTLPTRSEAYSLSKSTHGHSFSAVTTADDDNFQAVYSITGVGTQASASLTRGSGSLTATATNRRMSITHGHTASTLSFTPNTLPTRGGPYNLSKSNHVHSVSGTATADSTNVQSVYSITGVGTLPTKSSAISVATGTHTHGVSGSTSATEDTTSIYQITGVGSVPTRSSITVPSTTHTHDVTITSGANSK